MKVHLADSNAWSDGNEYIMGTASEVHTNALFDIFPNDTTITAEFKGNTQQNGTPSPSAPVPVVGVGYLDGTAYKIPVEIGLSTQSIDLSAVSSTRIIMKVVLKGDESIIMKSGAYAGSFYIGSKLPGILSVDSYALCTHAQYTDIAHYNNANKFCFNGSPVNINLWFSQFDSSTTVEQFREFLATEYNNGSPVTVYYILAEPTTGIVNEPLQKIGDYADSISNITLTTTAGVTSFGVITAVKPSEITLNFRGWHPKDPKESTGGEWS